MIQTDLSNCYGWLGQVYGPGSASIPEGLAIALGLSPSPAPDQPFPGEQPPEPDPPEPELELPRSLTLINEATAARQLTPIPTIGAKAASIIFKNRPEGGYASLQGLPDEIYEPPINASISEVFSWEG